MSTPPAIRSIPAAYDAGERAEYEALRGGCGIDRIAPRALADLTGADAARVPSPLRFRLFDPGPRDVRAAVLLDEHGLLTATATVVRLPGRLVLDCSNPTARQALGMPETVFAQDDPIVRMRLRGPALADVLGAAPPEAGALRLDLAPGDSRTVVCGTGTDRAAIYCARSGARACWEALVAAGALPVGSIALETVRIEDGEPCLERDFPQPQEPACAGVGEFAPTGEARVLVAIEHEGPRPLAQAILRSGGQQVGELRVGARSVLRAGRAVALATIDRALAAPGTAVDVDAGERVLQGAVMKRAALPVGSAAPNY
jgi:glycine cleavage system aminomethyltransferase T